MCILGGDVKYTPYCVSLGKKLQLSGLSYPQDPFQPNRPVPYRFLYYTFKMNVLIKRRIR